MAREYHPQCFLPSFDSENDFWKFWKLHFFSKTIFFQKRLRWVFYKIDLRTKWNSKKFFENEIFIHVIFLHLFIEHYEKNITFMIFFLES